MIYCNCKKELFAKINNGGIADADIPETLTRAQLEAHGAVARLRAEEPDEFTFVYLNEDGTRTSYSYGVAVIYI